MLNYTYRKTALDLLQNAQDKADASYNAMNYVSNELYAKRKESLELIKIIEDLISSIVGAPREFQATLEKISREKETFKQKEEYAEEAFRTEKAAGGFMAAGAMAGLGISIMTPQILKMIATTYGTTKAGVAIKTLKGAAKTKAVNAWIGRNAAKFLFKKGSNATAGKALMTAAGYTGYVFAAADIGIAMWTVSEKNRKVAGDAVEEAKEIEKYRESMDETKESISGILLETEQLFMDVYSSVDRLKIFEGANFDSLSEEDQSRLVALVDNAHSLAKLLNETVN